MAAGGLFVLVFQHDDCSTLSRFKLRKMAGQIGVDVLFIQIFAYSGIGNSLKSVSTQDFYQLKYLKIS